MNLNICEAHAFNTLDKFSLDVFVVNGWKGEVGISAALVSQPSAYGLHDHSMSQLHIWSYFTHCRDVCTPSSHTTAALISLHLHDIEQQADTKQGLSAQIATTAAKHKRSTALAMGVSERVKILQTTRCQPCLSHLMIQPPPALASLCIFGACSLKPTCQHQPA